MKLNEKKIAVLVVFGILCILFSSLMAFVYDGVDDVSVIAVNESNGDVAFAYIDTSGRADVARVLVFSKDGEKLYSQGYANEKVSALVFDGEMLYVSLAYDIDHTYDREGNSKSRAITDEELQKLQEASYKGWKSSFGKESYTLGEYEYCLEKPTLFKRVSRVTIIKDEKTTVIYESAK